MADYYSILKKYVSGLPNNTAENRQLVYRKARATIDRQLRSLDPPPSEEAIAAQMSSLDSTIDRIEDEMMVSGDGGAFAQPAAERPPQATRVPRPEAEPGTPAPRPAAAPAPAAPAPAAPASERSFEPVPSFDEETGAAPPASEPVMDYKPRRSRRISRFIVWLLVLVILAGAGYALWLNREPLLATTGLDDLLDTGNGEQVVQIEEEPVSEGEAVEKEEVRLGADGQTIDATDDATPDADLEENSTDDRDIRVIGGENENVEVSPVEERDIGEDAANPTQLSTDEGEDESVPAQEEVAVPAIGQKAYLYEEGLGNSAATRDNAAIIWSIEEESPGEGLPPEPVIKGLLEVPGRGLAMDLSIRRNVDESLSASHIIELIFDVPPDFSGGSIDTLARFVMKGSEQARGEPLVAVPVKIDAGFFMIALNNLQQARESNKRLLLESSWIDIPLGYTSGRRALVTLEKGAIGERVFRDAFDAWDEL